MLLHIDVSSRCLFINPFVIQYVSNRMVKPNKFRFCTYLCVCHLAHQMRLSCELWGSQDHCFVPWVMHVWIHMVRYIFHLVLFILKELMVEACLVCLPYLVWPSPEGVATPPPKAKSRVEILGLGLIAYLHLGIDGKQDLCECKVAPGLCWVNSTLPSSSFWK